MWNLIKNIFRSLSKNKIAMVGLTFLTFLSVGMFTILKSTTTNIDTTYEKVSLQGRQHDFTISENYNVGNINFAPGVQDESSNTGKGVASKGELVYWPDQTGSGSSWTKTYYLKLQGIKGNRDSLIDQFYNDHYADDPSTDGYKLIYRTLQVQNDNQLTYMTGDHSSSFTQEAILNQLNGGGTKSSDLEEINSFIASWSNEINTYVSQTNSPLNQYLLSQLKDKIDYRSFNSLKIDNSPDNIYYDVVQSCPADSKNKYEDIVDREIIFDNDDFDNIGWNNFSLDDWMPSKGIQNRSDLLNVLSYQLEEWNVVKDNEEKQKIIIQKFEVLSKGGVSDGAGAALLNDINKINDILLKGGAHFSEIQQLYESFRTTHKMLDIYNKQYAFVLSWESGTTNLPSTWRLQDWTSYFGICAPQYLQANNLKPLDVSKLMQEDADYLKWIEDHQDIFSDRQRFISWMNSLNNTSLTKKNDEWSKKYKNNYVQVGGGTPYGILAAGITGDFIYPVVSIEKPIPNTSKECIVFTNESGYLRTRDAFRGNQTENYIVGKFKNIHEGKTILNEINEWSRHNMSWPESIPAAYMADDMTNTLNASAFRIAYIPQLVNKIDLIDYVLTLFILGLGLLVSAIVVRRYVNNNRTTIGIMQANGIRKWSIALSLTPFALLPSIIGGICGYIFGTFMQTAAINLFSAYWTLPTNLIAFSWASLFISIGLPFLIFTFVSIVSTYIVLHGKTNELMKAGSEYKSNWISRNIKKPFSKFNVIVRFRVSIAFNSLWKLLILCVMSSLAMSTLVFGMTLNGKFESALNKTLDTRNYSYSIDLYSPTCQGGQYIPVSENDFGISGFNESASNTGKNFMPDLYLEADLCPDWNKIDFSLSSNLKPENFIKSYYGTTFSAVNLLHPFQKIYQEYLKDNENPDKAHGNLFIPFLSDSVGQKVDLQYLKNRTATKLSLNYLIGLSFLGMSSNPWDITASMMPENTKNTCDDKYEKIVNLAGNKWAKKLIDSKLPETEYTKYFSYDQTDGFKIKQSVILDYTGMALDRNFLQFLFLIYNDPEINALENDFVMQYNSIPLGTNEETYTYMNADGINTDVSKRLRNLPKKVKIMGIDNLSQHINLLNEKNEDLKELISYSNKNFDFSSKTYPMIINQLVKSKYGIKIGDKISFNLKNKSDRFKKIIKNEKDDSFETFEIVGVTKSCEGEEFFVDQQIANYLLGLKSKFSNDKYEIHNWYINYKDACSATLTPDEGLTTKASFNDLNKLKLKTEQDDFNINPYGFNGYFTKDLNGSKALTNGLFFYSPNGIWGPSDSISSNATKDVFNYGANLEMASQITGIASSTDLGEKIHNAYEIWNKSQTKANHDLMIQYTDEFANKLKEVFGNTTLSSLVVTAMDKNSNATVYKTMSNTISQIELVVLVVIALMVFFIVLLISSILIADSKKLAAMLKSLGYTDIQNSLSFMSIYLPVILIGLLIAIPLTIGFTTMFQSAVLGGIGLLLDTSTKWYFYLTGAFVILVELSISLVFCYVSLRKDRLVDLIK